MVHSVVIIGMNWFMFISHWGLKYDNLIDATYIECIKVTSITIPTSVKNIGMFSFIRVSLTIFAPPSPCVVTNKNSKKEKEMEQEINWIEVRPLSFSDNYDELYDISHIYISFHYRSDNISGGHWKLIQI